MILNLKQHRDLGINFLFINANIYTPVRCYTFSAATYTSHVWRPLHPSFCQWSLPYKAHCHLISGETTQLSSMTELLRAQGYPITLIGPSNQNGFSLGYLHAQTPLSHLEHTSASHASSWREGKDIYLTLSWKYSQLMLQDVVKIYFVGSVEAGICTFCGVSHEAVMLGCITDRECWSLQP